MQGVHEQGTAHVRSSGRSALARGLAGESSTLTVLGIRHAAVEHAPGAYYGNTPHVGLSARGRAQAETLARELTGYPLQAVYSSPFTRAHETARIIAASAAVEVRLDSRLGEWQFWEAIHSGGSFPPVRSTVNAARTTLLRHPDDTSCGESLDELRRRLTSWLDDVTHAHRDGVVVAITHFDALRCLLTALLPGRDDHLWNLKIEHCHAVRLHPEAVSDPRDAESIADLLCRGR